MSAEHVHLVMFDVDGTLVDSAGFDSELYAEAARTVLGVEVDRSWRSYRHVTDSGVLEELLSDHAPEQRGGLRKSVRDSFIDSVRRHLGGDMSPIREIRGAKRLVDALVATAGVRVAIATGGWHETTLLKLAAIGLDASRIAVATSSDAVARVDIMRLAEQRALTGAAAASRRTYFGDAAWDRSASAELGYDFVAVGNTVHHPTRYADLSELDAILEHLAR
jgi:phosphoglycolate phosphatase-like HAD superfamily hydrolase